MGPPGSFRQDITTALCEEMGGYKSIAPGDLFKKEIAKKTEIGKRIMACYKAYHYVDDQIVIDLVQREIANAEKDKKSWILQGFPRTKVQALALQKMGILPDKFILLKVKYSAAIARMKNNLIQVNQSLYGNELEDLAGNTYKEYELNMKGVKEVFN